MTFDLSPRESAGSRSLDRLVGQESHSQVSLLLPLRLPVRSASGRRQRRLVLEGMSAPGASLGMGLRSALPCPSPLTAWPLALRNTGWRSLRAGRASVQRVPPRSASPVPGQSSKVSQQLGVGPPVSGFSDLIGWRARRPWPHVPSRPKPQGSATCCSHPLWTGDQAVEGARRGHCAESATKQCLQTSVCTGMHR